MEVAPTPPPSKSPSRSAPVDAAANGNVNVNGHGQGQQGGTNNGGGPQSQSAALAQQMQILMKNMSQEEEKRPPKWQLDLTMEKLRYKAGHLKPLVETAKNIRQALMERRCVIDQSDKLTLQRSLDSLQRSIKVNTLQSMVARLEMVARQLGLRFTPGATDHEWFIHSDMFYLEVFMDASGNVDDVKIHHSGKTEMQSCPEIAESLQRTDFPDFTSHLEGLVSMYQLNADKNIKNKAYIALQCLEADLASMSSSYAHHSDAEYVVMKTLLGVFQPRRGGHPVKLVYYVSPYEFLDSSKSTLSNDVKTVIKHKLGCSATINIQASSSHKLQMHTTVNLTKTPDGKSIPRYGSLTATNSTVLPASYVLHLTKPVPMCLDLVKAIQATTEIEAVDFNETQPILNILTHQLSEGTLTCSSEKGLFVTLPDQAHCYFMTDTPTLEGILVSSISFTLASQLPQVFILLRQQLAFNTLVGSCVRVGSKPEIDHIVFEVNALSHQKLSVSFQHPLDDSLVTMEFDLRDITQPHCRLHAVANASDIIPTLEEHACKVVKRSMSIPITLRAVIRRWQSMKGKHDPPNPDYSVSVGGSGTLDSSRASDRSCGAESSERMKSSGQQHGGLILPPGILNMSNSNKSQPSLKTPLSAPPTFGGMGMSPFATGHGQNPMENIMSYMSNPLTNPFMSLTGFSFGNISPSVASQMLQMTQPSQTTQQLLMGLLDHQSQQNQAQKRRKRKNTSDTQSPSPRQSPRPNQSPSPSPSRLPNMGKSPIRRQSEGSDGGMNLLMNEIGMEITAVNNPDGVGFNSSSMDDLESFRRQQKKTTPKRSLSLDSHSSEDIASIQSLLDGHAHGHGHGHGHDFKPVLSGTPSVSITPVSTTSKVESLLASIRPGIEIIPLPTPVTIPTSLTVTPINNTSNSNMSKAFQGERKNKPKDRNVMGKRKFDGDDSPRPSKIPFLDAKGRMSPGGSMTVTKKPNSPLLSSPNKSGGGKPSVSTLKSVSSPSSKFGGDGHGQGIMKPKMKKQGQKGLKSFSGLGNIPVLKSLSAIKIEPGTAMSMSGIDSPDINKADVKPNISQLAMTGAGAPSSGNNNGSNAPPGNQGQGQGAMLGMGGIGQKQGKKIAGILDKLHMKATHSSTEISPPVSAGDKKDALALAAGMTTMTPKDYLKVSSVMADNVAQQKKALGAGTGNGGVGVVPGQPGSQEYSVKGSQGLKLTINKAKFGSKDPKSPKPLGGTLGQKQGLGMVKKSVPGMKPLSNISALHAKLSSLGSGLAKKVGLSSGKEKNANKEELTKKLFSPGSVKSLEGLTTAPIFDSKFQIPKKVKATIPTSKEKAEKEKEKEGGSVKEKVPQITPLSLNQMQMDVDVTVTPVTIPLEPVTTATVTTPTRSDPPPLIEVSKMFGSGSGTDKPAEQEQDAEKSGNEFSSPESPDAMNSGASSLSISAPQTIPTTPLNQAIIMGEEISPTLPPQIATAVTTSSSHEDQPESQPQGLVSQSQPLEREKQVTPPLKPFSQPQPEPEEVDEEDQDQLFIADPNEEQDKRPVIDDAANEKISDPDLPQDLSQPAPSASETPSASSEEKVKSPEEMPPPAPPITAAVPVDLSSSSLSGPSAPSPGTLPPPSPKSVMSPTVAIGSVHIVHSPQPNSPAAVALLRSPLVVHASPAASPYPIDDDLMDEALIGGSSK